MIIHALRHLSRPVYARPRGALLGFARKTPFPGLVSRLRARFERDVLSRSKPHTLAADSCGSE